MSLNISDLSTQLLSITRNTDFSAAQDAVSEAGNRQSAGLMSLMNDTGEIRSGIESLTNTIDFGELKNLPNMIPNIGEFTKDIPGMAEDLIGTVPSADAADLLAITETAANVENGFLENVHSLTSAEAVSAALEKITGKDPSEFEDVLKGLTTSNLESFVMPAVTDNISSDAINEVMKYVNLIKSKLNVKSDQYLVDMGEKIEKNYESQVQLLVDRTVSDADITASFILFVDKNYTEAFNIIKKYITVPDTYWTDILKPQSEWTIVTLTTYERVNAIEESYLEINTDLSSYTDRTNSNTTASSFTSLVINEIGKLPQGLNSQNSATTAPAPAGNSVGPESGIGVEETWAFEEIKTFDELEATFRNVTRTSGNEIAGCTIHWTETFSDQDVDSVWIDAQHKEAGAAGIGYHLVIRRDGVIEAGRPMAEAGAHDKNHNKHFLGFAFVGGLNETSDAAVKPYTQYRSSKSITAAQWTAYHGIMASFHRVFPQALVAGHYMTSDDGDTDPAFDVVGYSKNKFNHNNVIPEGEPEWKTQDGITIEVIRDYLDPRNF